MPSSPLPPFPPIPMAVDISTLVLRATCGIGLAYHGWLKIDGGAGNFAAVVDGLEVFGASLPRFLGYVVIYLELVGGALLVAGLLTRIMGALLAVQFLMIPFVVKSQNGLVGTGGKSGFEIDLLIAAIALTLTLLGPGRTSLDRVLGLEPLPRLSFRVGPTRPTPAPGPTEPREAL